MSGSWPASDDFARLLADECQQRAEIDAGATNRWTEWPTFRPRLGENFGRLNGSSGLVMMAGGMGPRRPASRRTPETCGGLSPSADVPRRGLRIRPARPPRRAGPARFACRLRKLGSRHAPHAVAVFVGVQASACALAGSRVRLQPMRETLNHHDRQMPQAEA
jgi:hypothetical protein